MTDLIDHTTVATAKDTVERISRGELSSVEAVQAVIDRMNAVNPQLNALVIDRFDAALEEAAAADEVPADQRRCLHGLPVTIKEMFDVRDLPTTVGLVSLTKHKARSDAAAVAAWRAAGAIVIGKTNVPQLGMMVDCNNPVYGRTLNPWNLERTPGGSSGGEAAMIAAGASPLGLASDGGGSIRQPSHFSGVCGFKPTGGRFSITGHWSSRNWPIDWATPGPMARTVDDLVLGLQAMDGPDSEPSPLPSIPIELTPQARMTSRRIGVYESLDVLPACSMVRRAVREVADRLAASGFDVIDVEPPPAEELWALYMAIFYAEGLRHMKQFVAGTEVDPSIRQIFQMTKLPAFLRPLAASVMSGTGQKRVASVLRSLKKPVLSAEDYCELIARMHAHRRSFHRRWSQNGLVAMLAPAGPSPAVHVGDFHANFGLIYNGIYNLLGVPAGVVPVTRVRPGESSQESYAAGSRDDVDRSVAAACENSDGLPIGVQVIGAAWRDNDVLAVMKAVEQSRCEYPEAADDVV